MTVKLNAIPPMAFAGAVTAKCVAAAALTAMRVRRPVIELLTVSVAVIVCVAGGLQRRRKRPGAVRQRRMSDGNVAAPSELAKFTVPA